MQIIQDLSVSDADKKPSANRDWLRTLQKVAPIEGNPTKILADYFEEAAAGRENAPAVIDDAGRLTFGEFGARARVYARWALASGLRQGDVVALLMSNRADYAALWLGLTQVGVVCALINTHLPAGALAHCLRTVAARRLIAEERFSSVCREALGLLEKPPALLIFEAGFDVAGAGGSPLTPDERPQIGLADRALYIFTSGTTGLPKAAIVTHRRLVYWSLWFAGLADMGPQDRMFNCLPMYHSVGGVVAVWSVLLAGGSVVLRRRFSATQFWEDVASQGCTLFQYIGELCRYLLNAPDCAAQSQHQLRLALGNGLRGDVWTPFQTRFAIPRILEFYAATESNFSLYNVEGAPGAIGRVPAFLSARFPLALVVFDDDVGQPARDADGFCIRCGVDQPGEAIARIETQTGASANFDGYAAAVDTEKKILRNVFEPGDAWMRSGDLMRKDARGFFYFVDRLGDSFRWKGENVSTLDVAETLARCPGVRDATVFGVAVPGCEGRAGMAALVVGPGFDLAALWRFTDETLPTYARPLFLRLSETLAITETFKHKKQELAAQGFDPEKCDETVYFAAPGAHEYVALNAELYRAICEGGKKL